MAKKEKEEVVIVTAPESEPLFEQPAPEPIRVEPRISFDVWFQCKGRSAPKMTQPHHKIGMKQFASTSGKKTKSEWDRIFSAY